MSTFLFTGISSDQMVLPNFRHIIMLSFWRRVYNINELRFYFQKSVENYNALFFRTRTKSYMYAITNKILQYSIYTSKYIASKLCVS